MKDNARLKKDLIMQSLSLAFVLLIVKHFHMDFLGLYVGS